MAKLTDLTTLAKTSVGNNDYFLVTNSTSGSSKRLSVASMFPAVSTAGTSSETLYTSATLTNKNQIVFKGIKSGDTGLLTVATTSNNIVLTALEAGIDLSLCNNATSGFLTSVDFTGTVTGENGVTNGGTGLSTIAKGAMLYASATDTIAATSAMSTNGQLLIGNATTGIPTLATLTAGTNITITNTAGAISIAASLSTLAGILDMANNNIDLGTAYISADGSTNQGIRVTAANTYLGASGSYFNDDILNIGGGGIRFSEAASVKPRDPGSGVTGKTLTIEGGPSSGSAAAGNLNLTGGTAAGTGSGGTVTITAGRDTSGSADGTIVLKTYTGGTATTAMSIGAEGQDVTIDTGNIIMSSKGIFMRNSSYPDVIKYQGNQATTDDGTTAVSAANILTGIVECTPTADRSKATDTASNLISGLNLSTNNDSFDFSFINLATDGTSFVTLTAGSGVTLTGSMIISAQDSAEDAFTSGVGRFRVRRVSGSAVTIYRIG
tara:strand:+ start:4853 stop:6337 length:1485 start_codon:yes stop_codon:yes gene_type:complete